MTVGHIAPVIRRGAHVDSQSAAAQRGGRPDPHRRRRRARSLRRVEQGCRGAHAGCDRPRHRARPRVRALQRLFGAQGRPDRQRIDSDLGAVDHDLSIYLEVLRREARDDSAEQHGADDGLRWRIRRGGHRVHTTRAAAARLQPPVDEGRRGRPSGRIARRLPHDPAAQRADRERAQDTQVSRGDGGGRGVDRRRRARCAGAHGVPGLRSRGALQVSREWPAPLAGGAALRVSANRTQRKNRAVRRDSRGDQPGAHGCRLHHRPAHCGLFVRRRLSLVLRAHSDDQALWRRAHGHHSAGHGAHSRYGRDRGPRELRLLHWRGRSDRGRLDQPSSLDADDRRGVGRRIQAQRG